MKFLQYISYLFCLTYPFCSTSHVIRIGEGAVVESATTFPFFAQLAVPDYPTASVIAQCGGALLNPWWIITAGHCFPSKTKEIKWLIDLKKNIVFMGSILAYDNPHCDAVAKPVVHILHHPKYLRKFRIVGGRLQEYLWNDLAIARVKTPFKITPMIQPIQISFKFKNYHSGILIGSGFTEVNVLESNAKVVGYALMPIKKYNQLKVPLNHKTNTTFYLEGIIADEGENSTGYGLYGDDGGPFVTNVTGNKKPTLLGILSVIEYSVWIGRAVHAVERVDLAKHFLLKHIPGIKHSSRSELQRLESQTINTASNSTTKKITSLCFIFLYMYILHILF